MNRRGFLKKTAAGAAAGTLGFPMIAKAQAAKTFHWKMTTTWRAKVKSGVCDAMCMG